MCLAFLVLDGFTVCPTKSWFFPWGATSHQGMTLLHCAAVHGHVEPVRLLLEAGAEKDATTMSGMMPLHFAAHSNHLDVVRCLIESGAKTDELTRATGSSPLHVASVEGNLQIVRCLVEFKAKIDQPTLSDGSTPLCLASDQGHLKIVRFLLRAGANKDGLRSDGSSPLHLASEQNHLEVVQCLLRAGANKDQLTTDEGYTALHLAAFRGHIDIVRLLVESRANCLLTGHDGRTALKVASDRRRRKIVAFLRSVPEFQTTPASRKARRVGSKENKWEKFATSMRPWTGSCPISWCMKEPCYDHLQLQRQNERLIWGQHRSGIPQFNAIECNSAIFSIYFTLFHHVSLDRESCYTYVIIFIACQAINAQFVSDWAASPTGNP